MKPTLICLSHVRFDRSWQRPQHLMSRLASRLRVVYVEEPWLGGWRHVQEPTWEERPGLANLRVMRPLVPFEAIKPGATYDGIYARMFDHVLADAGPDPIIWASSPLVPLAALARSPLVVYDCADEAAGVRETKPDALKERERHLLGMARLVFAGGISSYETCRAAHPAVHCFPSGVDPEHCRRALLPSVPDPADVADLPRPRVGYFGVLDEHIDWPLIDALAAAHPEWRFVFVGPCYKVEPADLPRRANVRYLGQRSYDDMPQYLRSFDVAIMPFARNPDAARFGSTRVLEYLGAHLPVVSTSGARDLTRLFHDRLRIGDGVAAFGDAVEAAIREAPAERVRRAQLADEMVGAQSWDNTVARMWQLIEEKLATTTLT
jgi:glycosyltransferase involved in cell wall biosynthesis